MERIYGCIYVRFEAILGFTRNEQIVCLEVIQVNINGAKHSMNVTSHVGLPKNVSGENMIRFENVQKYPKNN